MNGMSNRGRDGANANSAVIVGVSPRISAVRIFLPMAFQRKWEKLAYEEGRLVPVQLFGDFKEKSFREFWSGEA